MGLNSLRIRLAGAAPAPVFVVCGLGGRERVVDLYAEPGLQVYSTPRHAGVLLVVGRLTRGLVAPALQAHDQMASPRLVVRWTAADGDDPGDHGDVFPNAVVAHGSAAEVAAAVAAAHRELLAGDRPPSAALLADIEPAPWQGVGPYGTGGTGMTGGVPFGRPMAARAADRDDLELDQLKLRLGPLLPSLPSGLVLDVALQGDVVQSAAVGDNPYRLYAGDPVPAAPAPGLFERACHQPVRIAELERARARHHLRWAAGLARLVGLEALGVRLTTLSARLAASEESAQAERLLTRIGRSRWVAGTFAGGDLDDAGLAGLGPVARAAGSGEDARSHDPAYRALGFEPVMGEGGDTPGRVRQRLAEAVQALRLATAAGDATTTVSGVVEGPRGRLGRGAPPPSAALVDLVAGVVEGLEWGDAVAAIASLDLDVEEAARHPQMAMP